MNLMQAIKTRHSVRRYIDKNIESSKVDELQNLIDECNRKSGLSIQLCINDPNAFKGLLAKYGKFSNVTNYIAMVGNRDENLEEKCGYFGEQIVLRATQLGLSTCWVAASYKKSGCSAKVRDSEKLCCVIALGYGENNGTQHKSKSFDEVVGAGKDYPKWFKMAVEAALKAPTAMNQQKFIFTLIGENTVKVESKRGFYTKLDLGIVKYHFEIGADGVDWQWA